MPHRIIAKQDGTFAVVYYFVWDEDTTLEMCSVENRTRAEEMAEALNKEEQVIAAKMDPVWMDLQSLLQEDAESVLDEIETWLTAKRAYLQAGMH